MRNCSRSCNEPFAADALVAGVLRCRAMDAFPNVRRNGPQRSATGEIAFNPRQWFTEVAAPAVTGGFVPSVAGHDARRTRNLIDQSPAANPRGHSGQGQ